MNGREGEWESKRLGDGATRRLGEPESGLLSAVCSPQSSDIQHLIQAVQD